MASITTLLELLTEHKVVIPKIQRDYAQGRVGKENVFDSILSDIKAALKCQKVLTMDYVYGVTESLESDDSSSENERFYPLDGQQRLTTLWLVHWYVALRAGVSKDDKERNKLRNFSYETRESSSDFCDALCSKEIKVVTEGIESYIKKQTWFFNSWIQDPTIKSMLHGLGLIEKHFADDTDNDFVDYWDVLCKPASDNDCRIKFEKLVFEEKMIPNESADDLFIKMNARGKQLSEFENLKSDWVTSLTQDKDFYSKLIDNDWTDVFWKYAKKVNENMDDLFMNFINRYVLCKDMIMANSGSFAPEDIKKILQDSKKTHTNLQYRLAHSFRYIMDYETYDSGYKGTGQVISDKYPDYLTFLDYKEVLTNDSNMKEIESILSWFIIDKSTDPHNPLKTIDLELKKKIEDICQKNKVEISFFGCDSLTQTQRIYFYAVCKFLVVCSKLAKNSLIGLNRWMRILRNIVLNSDIRSEQATYECLKIVDDLGDELLAKKSIDIYEILKDYKNPSTKESLRAKRLEEECFKARHIKADPSIAGLVRKAEDYAFFNGVITFLFDESITDTKEFKKKFISRFTKIKGVLNKNDEYVSVDFIRQILKYFQNFEDIRNLNLFISKGYSDEANKPSFRDNILCGRLTSQEEWGLTKNDPERVRRENLKKNAVNQWIDGENINSDPEFEAFIDSKALDKIVEDDGEAYICLKYGNVYFLYKVRRGNRYHGIIIRKEKSMALNKLGVIVEPDSEYISQCNLFWGLAVRFKYNGNDFCWGFEFDNKNPKDFICLSKDWAEKKNGKEWNLPDEIEGILKQF